MNNQGVQILLYKLIINNVLPFLMWAIFNINFYYFIFTYEFSPWFGFGCVDGLISAHKKPQPIKTGGIKPFCKD
jgi:hypothetical protein